jgi:oligosaccharide repeat unit polymerase
MQAESFINAPTFYPERRVHRAQVAFGLWISLSALPVLVLGAEGFSTGYSMYFTALAAALTLPILLHGVDRPFDLFEPIWAITIVYALEFLIKPVLLLADPFTYQLPYLKYVEPAMLRATWLGALGFVAFYCGYETSIPSSLAAKVPRLGWPWRVGRVRLALTVSAVLFGLAVAHFLIKGDFDLIYMYGNRAAITAGDGDLALLMHLLAWSVVAMTFALYLMRPSEGTLVRLVLTTGAVMVCMFMFAARMSLLFVIVGLVVVSHYTVKRIQHRTAAVLAAVLFVVAAAFGAFRGSYLRPSFSWSDVMGESLVASAQEEIQGYCDWDITATVVDYYPHQRAFYHGRLALESLYFLIPRRIWTDKPTWYGSQRIQNDIAPGLLSVADEGGFTGTSISQSALGEGYADWGILGVALYLFIYGCYWRWIYALLEANRFRFPGAMLFAPAFVFLPMVLRSFSSTIVNTSIWVAGMYLLCAWLGGVETRPVPHLSAKRK